MEPPEGPAGPAGPTGPCAPAGPAGPAGPCSPCSPAPPVPPVDEPHVTQTTPQDDEAIASSAESNRLRSLMSTCMRPALSKKDCISDWYIWKSLLTCRAILA